MRNVEVINLKEFKDNRGALTAIEAGIDIPFEIERIYYITKVPEGMERGFHSHIHLQQILLCLNGSVKIKVESDEIGEFILDSPNKALFVGPLVWREMYDFSESAVLLVLASKHYDEVDYIKDYSVFKEYINKY